MKSGLTLFGHAPCSTLRHAGFGGSPLDPVYQKGMSQISIVHEAAFLDSKSLVCGDSILGCKPSPTFLLYSPMLFRMTCMSEIPYACILSRNLAAKRRVCWNREGRSGASLHSLCFQEGKRQIEG
ncbi:hypothetical protein WJX75_009605 [Coccomyxa subellipsoidea]|uniref:Uncharacterized protein n=1 Tax=Coccomyxa subellipsoidea TaxID=248742 RepID=A0ABR2YUZ7_9CHLO